MLCQIYAETECNASLSALPRRNSINDAQATNIRIFILQAIRLRSFPVRAGLFRYIVKTGQHPGIRSILQNDILAAVQKIEGRYCPYIIQKVRPDDGIRVITVVPFVRINTLVAVP